MTKPIWRKAHEELPDQKRYGPYPQAEVILQCNHVDPRTQEIEPWQRMQLAELRWLGGPNKRPIWVGVNKPQEPLENDAWFVSHWRPIPKFPKPVL